MVYLLANGAFGSGPDTPSPISPVFNAFSMPSPPHSPSGNVSPLSPRSASRQWMNSARQSPNVSVPMTPIVYTEDEDPESPRGTSVRTVFPPRVDSFTRKSSISTSDRHLQKTAADYAARPLPVRPESKTIPTSAKSNSKPSAEPKHDRPLTPTGRKANPITYSLFPKLDMRGSHRNPPSPPRVDKDQGSPSTEVRPTSPKETSTQNDQEPARVLAKKQTLLIAPQSKYSPHYSPTAVSESKPAVREQRSHTDPSTDMPASNSRWQPRSSSLQRRHRTDSELSLDPTQLVHRPSNSLPPPITRRPSAAEVFTARENGASRMLKAGPQHTFQVAITHGPEIEGQTALTTSRFSVMPERDPRRSQYGQIGPRRAVSATGIAEELRVTPLRSQRRMSNLRINTAIEQLNSDISQAESLLQNRPAKRPQSSDDDHRKHQGLDSVSPEQDHVLGRGRSVFQRHNAHLSADSPDIYNSIRVSPPSPRTNQVTVSSDGRGVRNSKTLAPPNSSWTFPSMVNGPLQLRASTFNPFNPQLDPEALEAFSLLRDNERPGTGLELTPPPSSPIKEQPVTLLVPVVLPPSPPHYFIEAETVSPEMVKKQQEKERRLREHREQQEQQRRKLSETAMHYSNTIHRRQSEERSPIAQQQTRDQALANALPRKQSLSLPPNPSYFLKTKPLPPPPVAPLHVEQNQPIVVTVGPLAHLASHVR